MEKDLSSSLISTFYRSNIILLLVAVLLVYIFYECYWKLRNIPPGPYGLPVLGFWPFLKSEDFHLQLQEFKEKYGDLYSFTVTGHLFINLGNLRLMKEALVAKSDCFENKCLDYSLLSHSFDGGVSFVNGEPWKVLRKFFLQKLKEFGVLSPNRDAASSAYDSVRDAVEEMHKTEGRPQDISKLLTLKCLRIVRLFLFNDRGITEEELREINEEYEAVVGCMTSPNLLLMGAVSRYALLPFVPGYREFVEGDARIKSILSAFIRRRKAAFTETQSLDIVDDYFEERIRLEKRGKKDAQYFTDEALLHSLYQFITDGVLTVSFFITSLLQALAELEDEQQKIYEEILEVVGEDIHPTLEDRPKLSYTMAFIHEALRCSNTFAAFPSLQCTRETTLGNYKIPVGSILLMNTWSAHRDPDTFEDPYTFDPSRFLPSPTNKRVELPLTFGFGKRACIGEPYVMSLAFLFTVALIQNFQIKIPQKTGTATSNQGLKLRLCVRK